jgi:alcohol oxidase
LHVLVEKEVVRVLLEDDGEGSGNKKKAVGVEYQTNPKYLANPEFLATRYTARRTVRARKMVVLSAGANGTPGILERSGVGNPDVLQKAGVEVQVDLKGVGEEYQDHHLSLWAYRTSLTPQETINGFQDGRVDVAGAIRDADVLLGTNGMDAQGKLRPTEEEVDGLGQAFRRRWDADFKEKKDKPLMIVALYTCYYGDHSTLPDGAEYVSQANWTAYPYSRGSIHITGPSPADRPEFNTGWLDDEGGVDIKKHVWAYKVTRDMWRRMPIFRGELATDHPRFPEGSKAAIVEVADGPLEKEDGPRMQYTEDDDKAIEQKVREVVSTTWHSLGTCKMAEREKGGVVDGGLRVYGVEGLRCADLSIVPENVGANTGNTAYVVGEKAADLFIQQLGLGGDKGVDEVSEQVQARL